jgi:cullin-4
MTLRGIFYYMDQSYLLRSVTNPVINEMGLIQFRNFIFLDCVLRTRVLQGACDFVDYDRKGAQNMMDPGLLRRAIAMFHDLGVYTKAFEPQFLEESTNFFGTWADREGASKPLGQFVQNCHELIQSEMKRCDLFSLDSTTRRELSLLVDENLVTRQKAALLNKDSILDLMEDGDIKTLEQLYLLLERQNLGRELRDAFESYIVDTGSDIVFEEKREAEMVIRLLELKKLLDNIWKTSFHKHESLGHALRGSFETFINKTKKTASNWGTDNPKPGEMIAKHVDMILRGGSKSLRASMSASRSTVIAQDDDDNEGGADEDAEISSQLDQVLDLFRFVHGKAVFEAFYKRDLARRLLMARSASADAESSMLTRLKNECGSNFTHNLEQMFKDMELARDEMASYKTRLHDRGMTPEIDLNVNVLSAAAWPTYPDAAMNVPDSISKAVRDFDLHYNSKHSGRKLAWKHNLAHCQLKASFPKGDKEIVVSSSQAIVLLLFNDVATNEPLSYTEIQTATGLSKASLFFILSAANHFQLILN